MAIYISVSHSYPILLDLFQESREAKGSIKGAESRATSERERNDKTRMLWRAFQFAFRVYSFAGGHDDRSDKLSIELANEIEASS